jgi:adenine C2-methylase RlmN of 23S rRNA A2503 and tRNA A37
MLTPKKLIEYILTNLLGIKPLNYNSICQEQEAGKDFKAKVVLEALKEKDTIEGYSKSTDVAQSNSQCGSPKRCSFCSFSAENDVAKR